MKTEPKILVLPVGTIVTCINSCYQDADEDEVPVLIYIKGKDYTVELQGCIKDEEGATRQWKTDWFNLTPEFKNYFIINHNALITALNK